MSFIIPKPGIDSIKPYKGGNHNISGENMINLASNESSMGPSPNAIKSLDKKNKTELSKVVAENLAKKAMEKKITKIYFDRGLYKYHGRVKEFAETLRKNGMEF